jgi:plasmid stabilization system protein ParE
MMLPVRALAEADEELDHAIGHYETESPGTGRRFLKAYAELLAHVSTFPNTGTRLIDYEVAGCELRSFVVSTTFPYTVFVAVLPEQIVILAVAHQHREPGYWATRLGELVR